MKVHLSARILGTEQGAASRLSRQPVPSLQSNSKNNDLPSLTA